MDIQVDFIPNKNAELPLICVLFLIINGLWEDNHIPSQMHFMTTGSIPVTIKS